MVNLCQCLPFVNIRHAACFVNSSHKVFKVMAALYPFGWSCDHNVLFC